MLVGQINGAIKGSESRSVKKTWKGVFCFSVPGALGLAVVCLLVLVVLEKQSEEKETDESG